MGNLSCKSQVDAVGRTWFSRRKTSEGDTSPNPHGGTLLPEKIFKHTLENNQLFPRYLVMMVHTSTSKINEIIIPINIYIKCHSIL